MTDHPITPPPELIGRWEEDWHHSKVKHIELEDHIATRAAQWGADQELEACCEWLVSEGWFRYEHEAVQDLRAARRPKPLSLKARALACCNDYIDPDGIIRRAIESLPD
jgi:predicted nucleotidyltransferase